MLSRCDCNYKECEKIRTHLQRIPEYEHLTKVTRIKRDTTPYLSIQTWRILRTAAETNVEVNISLWHYPTMCFDPETGRKLMTTCESNPDRMNLNESTTSCDNLRFATFRAPF